MWCKDSLPNLRVHQGDSGIQPLKIDGEAVHANISPTIAERVALPDHAQSAIEIEAMTFLPAILFLWIQFLSIDLLSIVWLGTFILPLDIFREKRINRREIQLEASCHDLIVPFVLLIAIKLAPKNPCFFQQGVNWDITKRFKLKTGKKVVIEPLVDCTETSGRTCRFL
ncbi:hypothetical protein BT63DRAFT_428793, partial [Microthyrium microscopicum]